MRLDSLSIPTGVLKILLSPVWCAALPIQEVHSIRKSSKYYEWYGQYVITLYSCRYRTHFLRLSLCAVRLLLKAPHTHPPHSIHAQCIISGSPLISLQIYGSLKWAQLQFKAAVAAAINRLHLVTLGIKVDGIKRSAIGTIAHKNLLGALNHRLIARNT